MNEELLNVLTNCLNGAGCEGCPYMDDPDCNVSLINASINAITQMDATISYLMELNNKLSIELQNSLEVKGVSDEYLNQRHGYAEELYGM